MITFNVHHLPRYVYVGLGSLLKTKLLCNDVEVLREHVNLIRDKQVWASFGGLDNNAAP